MALSFLKKKKAKKKPAKKVNTPARLNKAFMTVILTVSATLVAVISFISMELAILTFSFVALSSFLMFESDRRRAWEGKTDKNIRGVRQNHEIMARDIAHHRDEIIGIKERLSETAMTVRRQSVKTEQPENTRQEPPTLRAVKSGDTDQYASNPKGLSEAVQKTIANDDPYSDGSTLSDMVIKELVHHAVRSERIDVFVQPIVRLPQRKTRFYEIYARIRAKAGLYLPATRYMPVAQQEKLVNNIDHLLLIHCLKTIKKTAHIKKAAPFFINVTPATLKSTVYMKGLLNFLAKNRELAPRLVFEIRHKDFQDLSMPVLQILDGIGKLGCSFSLDHVQQEDFDIALLQKYKIKFLKLDAQWLLREMATERQFTGMLRIKRKLEANGIGVIIEKIETEDQIKELLDYDIHYGQGFLFGKPDLQGAYRQKKAA